MTLGTSIRLIYYHCKHMCYGVVSVALLLHIMAMLLATMQQRCSEGYCSQHVALLNLSMLKATVSAPCCCLRVSFSCSLWCPFKPLCFLLSSPHSNYYLLPLRLTAVFLPCLLSSLGHVQANMRIVSFLPKLALQLPVFCLVHSLLCPSKQIYGVSFY